MSIKGSGQLVIRSIQFVVIFCSHQICRYDLNALTPIIDLLIPFAHVIHHFDYLIHFLSKFLELVGAGGFISFYSLVQTQILLGFVSHAQEYRGRSTATLSAEYRRKTSYPIFTFRASSIYFNSGCE